VRNDRTPLAKRRRTRQHPERNEDFWSKGDDDDRKSATKATQILKKSYKEEDKGFLV
jgi:hypothetical protein